MTQGKSKSKTHAKLQVLSDGTKQFTDQQDFLKQINNVLNYGEFSIQSDNQDRRYLTFKYLGGAYGTKLNNQHGSALQMKGNIHIMSTDTVYALECDIWPSVASEWLTRRRKHGWPCDDLIQKIIIYGFIVVRAFHPQSNEKELQLRISFSRQEKELVVNFNMVQMKCYVLLKLIKKDIINKQIGEETLTSYHCKTCMFYILENTPEEIWIPENLASCMLMCLRQLRLWAMDGNCPNYFIPGENMFDRISNPDLKIKLFSF